jgi:hypothetical protein
MSFASTVGFGIDYEPSEAQQRLARYLAECNGVELPDYTKQDYYDFIKKYKDKPRREEDGEQFSGLEEYFDESLFC